MKDFKKLIREAHLGNPLNEVDNSNIQVENILKKLFGKKLDPSVIAILVDEINDIIKKKPSIKDNPEEIAKELAKDSDIDPKLLLKPRMGFIREEPLNEEFSSTEQKMIKQIQSYKKRGSAMVTLPSKVRDFYFKNKEKIDALNENMGEWPKELTSRYSDEYRFELEKVMSDRAKYRVIDIESGEIKGTPVFAKQESLMAYADDLIKPQGGTQSSHFGTNEGTCGYGEDGVIGDKPAGAHLQKEDMNDPVLVKTRAAQMKRDAMDKKDLENKSKRISVDKAIDLRYELSILNKEREDILMRIEDIGVEMEQTAEPEGGPIADKLGGRLMAAEKELRAVNNKIIDVRDELDDFDMNESNLGEGNGGAKQDDEINLNVSNANDIADEEEAHSGVLELRNSLKENLKNRLN